MPSKKRESLVKIGLITDEIYLILSLCGDVGGVVIKTIFVAKPILVLLC